MEQPDHAFSTGEHLPEVFQERPKLGEFLVPLNRGLTLCHPGDLHMG
jgi:hypothetical protein